VDKLQKNVFMSFERDRDLYMYAFGSNWDQKEVLKSDESYGAIE
jgi:hypothetical protein